MAQAISFNSGSPLIGSPIVFTVVASPHGSNYTFHRVKLKVYAGLGASDGQSDIDYTEFEFSTPVESNGGYRFDVSSALRAVADKYQYSATPPSQYPYVKFRLEAWDEYMIDGDEHIAGYAYYPGQNVYCYAFPGKFSDLERIKSDTTGRTTQHFTRKPSTSPEIVHIGKQYVRPVDFSAGLDTTEPSGGPKSVVYPSANTYIDTAGQQTYGETTVYAIAAPHDSYELRFINGLGCMESLHVSALRSAEVKIDTEQYIIARQETFTQFSRGIAVKSDDYETVTLTSGPVDEAWAAWYVHEFLMVRWVWIKVDGTWVPCHVLPEETTPLVNRSSGSIIEVQFALQLDITGYPLSALSV